MIMLFIVIPLAVIVALYLFCIMPSLASKKGKHSPDCLKKRYYAHRGFHDNTGDAPENSLLSFERAVQKGYGIELDVQLSSDNEVVVFHDETLERMCGVTNKVPEFTLDELSKKSLLGTEQNIPTLSEVLSCVDGRVPLLVELKPYGDVNTLCTAVDRVMSGYDGDYIIESFHPDIVTWYRRNRPNILRGQLSGVFKGYHQIKLITLKYLLTNIKARPDFIAYESEGKNNLSLLLCRNLFCACAVTWTIRSQEQLKECKNHFDVFIFEGFEPSE